MLLFFYMPLFNSVAKFFVGRKNIARGGGRVGILDYVTTVHCEKERWSWTVSYRMLDREQSWSALNISSLARREWGSPNTPNLGRAGGPQIHDNNQGRRYHCLVRHGSLGSSLWETVSTSFSAYFSFLFHIYQFYNASVHICFGHLL
jgi:hypothetical protein